MNKPAKVGLLVLGAFVVFCGTLAYTGHESGNENLWCPNATQHVRPTRPTGPDAIEYRWEEKQLAALVKELDKTLPLATVH